MKTIGSYCTFIIMALTSFVMGCTGDSFSLLNTSTIPSTQESLTTSVLSTGSYTDLTSTVRNFQLLKVVSGSGAPTFIQWIPNTSGSATAPTVLIYLQYDTISWTGLGVDSVWAARSSGAYPDSYGPYYNAGTSAPISFYGVTDTTSSGSLGFLYSYNNMNVAIVFGRFYAGGDIQDDINDAKNGMKFLYSQSTVDKTKIGMFGNSWGGMALLHGAAQLGSSMMPKAISVIYPAADIKQMKNNVEVTVPATAPSVATNYTVFFDPYLRRINKATEALAGQSTRYDGYSVSALSGITSDLFISHDAWDTIVPIAGSDNLLSAVGSTSKIHYYQKHLTALNYSTFSLGHTQSTDALNVEAATQWSYIFLLNKLLGTTARTAMVRTSILVPQFQYVKNLHDQSVDTSYYNDILAQLCVPNLAVSELDSGNNYDGPTILYFMMEYNYASGWAADGPAACTKLTSNPPF